MAAPGIPTNPTPSNGATNTSATPALTWSAPGATSFHVYLGPTPVVEWPDPQFLVSRAGAGVAEGSGVFRFDRNINSAPSGGLSPLRLDTTFYWRVYAFNADGVTVGPVWSFTVGTIAVPAKPSLISPTNGSTVRTFTLTWAAAENASAYDVKVGTSNPPTAVVSSDQIGTAYTATVTGAVTYYWQVIAKNAISDTAASPVWSFVAAAPATPTAPNPTDVGLATLTPTLSWTADGAASYDVYFGTSASPPLVSTAQSGATYTPAGPLVDSTTYFWKIVATNGAGSTTGPVWSFLASSEDLVTVLTSTSTGTLDNFNAGTLSAMNVIRMNNATLATIRGLTNNGAAPTDGQMVWIESVGAGQVDLANENASSSAANRLHNNVTATISLAAGSGRALFVYDGGTSRWRCLEHDQGAWISVPYAAGNFTGSAAMTWTVQSADQNFFKYWLKDRTLFVNVQVLLTSVGGTPDSYLQVALPGGFVAATNTDAAAHADILDNGARGLGNAYLSGTTILVRKADSSNWSASTNNTHVTFMLPAEMS